MNLRPYQLTAIHALYEHLRAKETNPCLVLPTGSGKSPCMAAICRDAVSLWQGRVLILAHRKELLEQTADKLMRIAPEVKVGIYSAGLNRREKEAPVVVAGIQSVYQRACELGKFDLVLVDEAHRIPPDGEGMYRTFLDDAKLVNPHLRIIGLTATPYRMGTGSICAPENLLHEVCYEIGIKELIVDGFLCKLISKSGKSESVADTSGVHIRGGEFIESELEAVMSEDGVVRAACREVMQYAETRKKCLIFCCGIIHAERVKAEIEGHWGRCGFVHGETPSAERAAVLDDFRTGELKFLVNVNVLTEGFDAPNIDLIALMRATKSPGLYYQMTGRGLRTAPDKPDCLVLDFGENIMRHGPIDKVRPRKDAGNGDGQAPTKICPKCQAVVYTAIQVCPECNYEWPAKPVARHEHEASNLSIISDWKTNWFPVEHVSYEPHTKREAPPGHPRTLRVTYQTGFTRRVSEWVCVEHRSSSPFAFRKAESWWAGRSSDPMPEDAEEAARLAPQALARPAKIQVREDGQGKELAKVIGYEFSAEEAERIAKRAVAATENQDSEPAEVVPGASEFFRELVPVTLTELGIPEEECPF